jgi:hypothetical protein
MRMGLARVGLAVLVVLGFLTGLAGPTGPAYAQGNGVHCPDGSHPPCRNGVTPANGNGGTTGAAPGAVPCNCTPQQQQEAASIVGAVYALAQMTLLGQIPDIAAVAILQGLWLQLQRLPPALRSTVEAQTRDAVVFLFLDIHDRLPELFPD